MSEKQVNEEKLNEFVMGLVGDMGAAATGVMVILGDKLGLYKAIAEAGSVTSESLAEKTGTAERYVREWLANQAASGYVDYDAANKEFSMSPEQQMVFSNEESPVYMTGGFYGIAAMFKGYENLVEKYKSGEGVSWADQHPCLFEGTAKFFRPSYMTHLIQDWIPALEGVQAKLEAGGQVADVGCGHGFSTLIMAKAFPATKFVGFDFHEASIETARSHAREAGLDNISFEVATAKEIPGSDYDLVTFFDCLHDMGDPAGAATHVRKALKPDGTLMVVEPNADDNLSGNMNPIGRVFYAFSSAICTPSSLSQEVGEGLGACAGEARLKEIIADRGGFSQFRRASETPFNMVLEARP